MSKGEGFGVGCFVLTFVALCILIPAAIWGISVGGADIFGRGNAHITIYSGPHRIAEYDKFFSLCTAVQNAEVTIDSQTKLLENNKDNQNVANVAQANIAANESARGQSINQYNAASLKNYNESQFKDSDLPYQLSTAPYVVGGPHTVCATQ